MGSSSADAEWSYQIGTSLIAEFAAGHRPSDVLREVVQNEYDAGGRELTLRFGAGALLIQGSGKTIDRSGWNRLAVMLGTGRVAGTDATVESKVNGIGSKNFGMRSLFLFGDSIYVRSGGLETVLDTRRGALRAPVPHEESRGKAGVDIFVPYRKEDDGELRAFTEDREREAITDMTDVMAASLVKLAVPKSAKGIARLSIYSERLGHRITWHQRVKALNAPGAPVLRSVRIEQEGATLGQPSQRYTEVEYGRLVLVPKHLRGRPIPSYFRRTGGRIAIGVSLVVNGRRLVLTPGCFYYPLGAPRARTGSFFSINAPFVMNEDRSQLLDPTSNEWNEWLLSEAAELAADTLPKVFSKYGAKAYEAFHVRSEQTSVDELAQRVAEVLSDRECWPSRAEFRGKTQFRQASTLTVPITELREISGLLDPEKVVHEAVASDPTASQLALDYGAKIFTTNSLVRLRCAGADDSGLKTKDAEGASWRFTNFPESLRGLDMQKKFAQALDLVRTQLSQANRYDLRTSPTTLTRAGDLAAPIEPLWVAAPELIEIAPANRTLHPELSTSKVLHSLCEPFAISNWVIATAEEAELGLAENESLAALRNLLLSKPALSKRAWASLRNAPVLLDHRGEATPPSELILRRAAGAGPLEPVLRFAPEAFARSAELVRNLHIRTSLSGKDLVRLAEAVEAGEVPADEARLAFSKHTKLLTTAILKNLRTVRFLETTTGTLLSATTAYEKNEKTSIALGPDHPWPVASYGKLLAKLKCRSDPSIEDIVARLRDLSASDLPLPHAESVYELLGDAARAKRLQLSEYADEPLLWTGRSWAFPRDCLLGSEYLRVFGEAIPVLSKPRKALIALGVPIQPTSDHWIGLFDWIRQSAGRAAPTRVRESVLYAYRNLTALPDAIPASWPVLLDERRYLHSLQAAISGRFLIDDDPRLADALRQSPGCPSFAINDPFSIECLRASGVPLLSEVAQFEGVTVGDAIEGTDLSVLSTLLARLADANFVSAVATLVRAECGGSFDIGTKALASRFGAIVGIDVVESIVEHYRVDRSVISTEVDHYVDATRIVLTTARTQDALRQAVARAVVTLIDPPVEANRLLPDAIYFLMKSRTASDFKRELEKRGIRWQPKLTEVAAEEDEHPLVGSMDPDVSAAEIGDAIGRAVMAESDIAPTPAPRADSPVPQPTSAQPYQQRQLPNLEKVQPKIAASLPKLRNAERVSPGSGRTASGAPRTGEQLEDDRRLGSHGEEIVFRIEQERVSARGQDPAEVIWVAAANPLANHDIRSIDEDGQEIWIEVKATVGRTGRFSWPKSEFMLAVAKRLQYYLYRVYETDTLTPTIVEVRDPVGRFQNGLMTIDLEGVAADIGPLEG